MVMYVDAERFDARSPLRPQVVGKDSRDAERREFAEEIATCRHDPPSMRCCRKASYHDAGGRSAQDEVIAIRAPAGMAAIMKDDAERWRAVIRAAGGKAE